MPIGDTDMRTGKKSLEINKPHWERGPLLSSLVEATPPQMAHVLSLDKPVPRQAGFLPSQSRRESADPGFITPLLLPSLKSLFLLKAIVRIRKLTSKKT